MLSKLSLLLLTILAAALAFEFRGNFVVVAIGLAVASATVYGVPLARRLIRHVRLRRQRVAREAQSRAIDLARVDRMSGADFEYYVGRLLEDQGYRVSLTAATGDFGVDMIAMRGQTRIAVQVKRHKGGVSRHAVSDAVAGRAHYHCNAAMVVTNSFFTAGAVELAQSTGCQLIDRGDLGAWILAFQNRQVPRPVGVAKAP